MEPQKRHPDKRGKVITFYSYKGGVGRSFILANVAAQLALWKYRVLCLDWDLEAPGLVDYFREEIPKNADQNTDGVVDLLLKYQYADDSRADWKNCLIDVSLRHRTIPSLTGNLHVIQAGRAAPQSEYISNVHKLDWNILYGAQNFASKLDELKREWQDEYDFVLVDSRTGISDISGICTVQLPDILALVLTANQQSLDGVFEVANRAVERHSSFPWSESKLITVPILSRLDQRDETKLAESWIAQIGKKLTPLFHSWLDRKISVSRMMGFCKVPYISRWSFGESLAVLSERGSDPEQVSHSLKGITGLLLGGLDQSADFVGNRDAFLRDVAGEEFEEIEVVFTDPTAQMIYESNSALTMESYARELQGFQRDLDDAKILYEKAIELDPHDAGILGNFALFLYKERNDHKRAKELFEQAINAEPNHAGVLGNFALFLIDSFKDYDRAEELFERAIKAEPNHAAILGNFAMFLTKNRKNPDRAEQFYKRAMNADPNHSGVIGIYAAFLADIRKDFERAEVFYRRAIDINSVESNGFEANNFGNFAGFLMSIGRLEEGKRFLALARYHDSISEEDHELLTELLFYEVAYEAPPRSDEALAQLLMRLKNGDRSDFNLDRHIEVAQKTTPARADFLKNLAAVINDKEPVSILDIKLDS